MTREEFMESGGSTWSWYCTLCGLELGVDTEDRDGETPCPEHGMEHIAYEHW